MDRHHEDSEVLVGNLLRSSPERTEPNADNEGPLTYDKSRLRNGHRSDVLISNELFEGDAISDTSDSKSYKRYMEASRKSLDFQMGQYLRYLGRVHATGMKPKNLLNGLEIADSGPNAPPPDFWCLIAVRDRLLSQSNALYEQLRKENREAWESLSNSFKFSGPCACMLILTTAAFVPPNLWSIPCALAAGLPPLLLSARKGTKVVAVEKCQSILQSVIQRATNWDLDGGDIDRLKLFAYWFWIVLL